MFAHVGGYAVLAKLANSFHAIYTRTTALGSALVFDIDHPRTIRLEDTAMSITRVEPRFDRFIHRWRCVWMWRMAQLCMKRSKSRAHIERVTILDPSPLRSKPTCSLDTGIDIGNPICMSINIFSPARLAPNDEPTALGGVREHQRIEASVYVPGCGGQYTASAGSIRHHRHHLYLPFLSFPTPTRLL